MDVPAISTERLLLTLPGARAARVLQRLGFTIEGTAKDYLFLAGRWQDHILTSLINPDAIALG